MRWMAGGGVGQSINQSIDPCFAAANKHRAWVGSLQWAQLTLGLWRGLCRSLATTRVRVGTVGTYRYCSTVLVLLVLQYYYSSRYLVVPDNSS